MFILAQVKTLSRCLETHITRSPPDNSLKDSAFIHPLVYPKHRETMYKKRDGHQLYVLQIACKRCFSSGLEALWR